MIVNKNIRSNMRDCTFKSITLDYRVKDFMCSIINEITNIPMDELMDGKFLNTYIPINHVGDKVRVSDIILSTKNYVINLEANKSYYPGVFKKNNSYYQYLLSNMYKSGKNYNLAKTVIQINFDCFSIPYIYPRKKISEYILKEKKDNNEFIENDTEKYYVDLNTLERDARMKKFKDLTRLERYLLVFKLTDIDEIKNLVGDDEIMKKVVEKIEEMNYDEELIGAYVKEERDEMILNTRLEGARLDGIVEGERSGFEMGLLESAKNLLKNNIDVDIISKVTGLSKAKIKSLDISS